MSLIITVIHTDYLATVHTMDLSDTVLDLKKKITNPIPFHLSFNGITLQDTRRIGECGIHYMSMVYCIPDVPTPPALPRIRIEAAPASLAAPSHPRVMSRIMPWTDKTKPSESNQHDIF